jgi:NAD(P)-dependent dehydrogenase (short-subunit alcohol dehydrogenase family)
MAIRQQFSGAFAGRLGMAFAAEILLGGVLPLILLARESLRQRADVLCVASLLAVLGVAFNRMNVVLFATALGARAAMSVGDVGVRADATSMVDTAATTFDGLDILVNNAQTTVNGVKVADIDEANVFVVSPPRPGNTLTACASFRLYWS